MWHQRFAVSFDRYQRTGFVGICGYAFVKELALAKAAEILEDAFPDRAYSLNATRIHRQHFYSEAV